MINPKYAGGWYVAVTRLGGKYNCMAHIESELLTKQLQKAQVVLPGMSVLKRFDGISPEAVDILDNAVRQLKAGEQLNLDGILA